MESPNTRCICELCTCGKHSCHQTLTAQDWDQMQPIYQRNRRTYLPSIGNNHPTNHTTTYKDHYQPSRRIKTEHHVTFKEDDVQPQNQRSTAIGHLPFIGTTSYRDHYDRKYNQQIISIMNPERTSLQPQYIRPNIKFEGESTYKSHYVDTPYMKSIRNINSQKVNRMLYNKQSIPFKGSSTYKDTYQPYIFQVKPISSSIKSPPSLKFDATSLYHDDYHGYTIRQEIQSKCPVESLPVPKVNTWQRNHIYYDSQTNKFI